MEIEYCNRIKSICYKDENIFRKYYKYSNDPSVEREAKFANVFKINSLPVAECLKTGFSVERQMRYNEFEYIEITPISEASIDEDIVEKTLKLIESIQCVKYEDDKFWDLWYEKDLICSLDYNPQLKNKVINLIKEIKSYPKTIIHGDFSLKNFSYVTGTNDLFLYDFQTVCVGPIDWDLAYFIATLPIECSNLFNYDERILTMIKIVTAVRLGRGSRSEMSIKRRKEIHEYWWSK